MNLSHKAEFVLTMDSNKFTDIINKSNTMITVWMRSSLPNVFLKYTWLIYYYYTEKEALNDVSGWTCPYVVMNRNLSSELSSSNIPTHYLPNGLPAIRNEINKIKNKK